MQSYRTCHASQITGVRVGQSAVAPLPDKPNASTDKRAHNDRLAAIEANINLTQAQKLAAVDKENQDWAANNKPVSTDTIVDHATGQTRAKSADEIKGEQTDENSDGVPDQVQDIIRLVLTGGEKRSILRSDITFSPTVLERRQADFPPYAQRHSVPDKNGVTGPNSVNSVNTTNLTPPNFVEPGVRAADYQVRADTFSADDRKDVNQDAYPRVGDWLVEDYDVMTDVWVQKIYDNATFGRYFKANLN